MTAKHRDPKDTDTPVKNRAGEDPTTIYGRLLEAAYFSGFAAERVAGEFKWLLTDERWKQVAGGFDDIDTFLKTINLAQYRISIDDRRDIVKLLNAAYASQRATAKALGIAQRTVGRSQLSESNDSEPPSKSNVINDRKPRSESNDSKSHEWFQQPPTEAVEQLQQQEVREAREQVREQRRSENRAKVEATADIISVGAKFATIAIDPPWDFGDEGDVDPYGRARPVYQQMSIDEIAALPVAELSDVDCHLYLWITNRSLPKGFALMERWGFRYITCLTWCKPSFGMGNYFRGSSEQILFGVKGSQPLKRKDAGTWFQAPRREKEHSSKPIAFYELVESCSPGPFLEIFSRCEREDWTMWGADAS